MMLWISENLRSGSPSNGGKATPDSETLARKRLLGKVRWNDGRMGGVQESMAPPKKKRGTDFSAPPTVESPGACKSWRMIWPNQPRALATCAART
jgi:hypothetical protein